jgi:hypothetical protein
MLAASYRLFRGACASVVQAFEIVGLDTSSWKGPACIVRHSPQPRLMLLSEADSKRVDVYAECTTSAMSGVEVAREHQSIATSV